MVKHNNPSLALDTLRTFNFKQGDQIGSDVGNLIVPVVNIERLNNIIYNDELVNATSSTIATTPSDKDFYIKGVYLSTIKDATSTSVYSRVRAYVDGVIKTLCQIECFTLTAQNECVYINFDNPVLCSRNTVIVLEHSTNVANQKSTVSIFGYTVDTLAARG